nr:MAG TPA: hypothetical protein [Caudoviricetes sp.]
MHFHGFEAFHRTFKFIFMTFFLTESNRLNLKISLYRY